MASEHLVSAHNALDDAPTHWTQARRPIRVLLIQPPNTGCVRSLLPQVEEDAEGIGYKPPLGILYCATVIDQWSPHEIRVLDAQAQQLDFDAIVREAQDFQPELVGISAWTDWWWPSYHTGELIKRALPGAHLCYGGPHVGIYPQETLDIGFVDSVIVGDGEVPFLFLANMLANGRLETGVQGLHFPETGVPCGEQQQYVHSELDDLPIPDRRLLPIKAYGSVLGKDSFVTTMITSRGCPHRCTFCKLNFQKTLARSAESVVEEFRRIAELGIHEVEIYDDTFTWSKKRLRAICEGLIQADLGVEWAVRDRVSSVDPELLGLMYDAGCRRIHFGIESGVEHVIKRMKKRITTDQARRAVAAAKAAKLTVLTYFMFGNLDETVEDMRATLDFALELDSDYAQFSITIPYAGTEMYDHAREAGLITSDFWREYARKPVRDFMPPQLIEEHADLETLVALRNEAVRRFYFRPRYVLRELARLRSGIEFLRKARMGARLLTSVYSR